MSRRPRGTVSALWVVGGLLVAVYGTLGALVLADTMGWH